MHFAIGVALVLVLVLVVFMLWKKEEGQNQRLVYIVTLAMAAVWFAMQLFLGLKS